LGVIGVAKNDIPILIPPESFQNQKVVRIQAARDFSVALTEQNKLYVWGYGLSRIPKWEQQSLTPVISSEVEQLVHKRHAKIKKFFAIG
jgi:alpha-tubulin suppressor-like RCC1 family protein